MLDESLSSSEDNIRRLAFARLDVLSRPETSVASTVSGEPPEWLRTKLLDEVDNYESIDDRNGGGKIEGHALNHASSGLEKRRRSTSSLRKSSPSIFTRPNGTVRVASRSFVRSPCSRLRLQRRSRLRSPSPPRREGAGGWTDARSRTLTARANIKFDRIPALPLVPRLAAKTKRFPKRFRVARLRGIAAFEVGSLENEIFLGNRRPSLSRRVGAN